ncbi:uncharacterized protein LOC131674458 [Phymastichus coffea]|uniref:uncharacterized protein LOC131674458 n=1 Tax=Phymastichus coffea TaxID=108790 RepID=UPI00273BC0E6|nr:uncharacterized protein LOC131674458 [Phymastichus coffea]
MDALELQAALVKLDPATTVTPLGLSVNLVPAHFADPPSTTAPITTATTNATPATPATTADSGSGGGVAKKNNGASAGPSAAGNNKCAIAEVR